MARHTWTIDFKDFIKFKNKEKIMEEIDLTPELKDLVAKYEQEIEECKALEKNYLDYISNYMKPYLKNRDKRIETEHKLNNLNIKISGEYEGDDE